MTGIIEQRLHRDQRIEALCAAAIRALAGDPTLHYREGRLHRGARPLVIGAPHLRGNWHDPEQPGARFEFERALVDAVALRLQYSDAKMHRRLRPADPVERLVFELLEQLRVESLVPRAMPGLAANIQGRFEAWSRAFHRSRLTETRLGLMLYALAQSCWSRLNGRPVLVDTEEIIETTRAKLVRPLGKTLAGIRAHRADQLAYALTALEMARIVAELVGRAQAAGDGERESVQDGGEPGDFALLLDFESDDAQMDSASSDGYDRSLQRSGIEYRVYSTRYDREEEVTALVRREQLEKLRERLDEYIRRCLVSPTRLARRLAMVLAVPQRDGWTFDEEEGRIDGRRLARVIGSPTDHRIFMQDRLQAGADCAVALLVDCSGSMKEHALVVAALADLLVRALERCGAVTEVLGFTTAAWSGGRPAREWHAAGRPGSPGRLNEALHLVFKSGERSWRRSHRSIAALLRPELFREGIDGEAIEWACGRLLARAQARRILVVFSDGSPMDAATRMANGEQYLANHLQQVVARHERLGDVEIVAIGVGLDLSGFYRRCLATDPARAVDSVLLGEIAQLIGAGRRR